jgi:hypothetical protein
LTNLPMTVAHLLMWNVYAGNQTVSLQFSR